MNDKIVVDFQTLDSVVRDLQRVNRELDQAMSQLSRLTPTRESGANLRLNGCGCALHTVGLSVGAATVSSAISSYRSAISRLGDYTDKLGAAVKYTAERFEETEKQLASIDLEKGESGSAASSAGELSSDGTSSNIWDWLRENGIKALGKAGEAGTLLSAFLTGLTASSVGEGMLKYLSKVGPATVKWAKELLKDRNPSDLVTKEDWAKLFGLNSFLKTPATSGTKWANALSNWKQGFTKGATSAPGWIAAIISQGIKNAEEYHKGDISSFRAFLVETPVEAAVSVLTSAAVAAGIAAAVPAASTIAVGVIATFTVGILDAGVKHLTGGTGIAETIGHWAGEAYDYVYKKVSDAVKNVCAQTKATLVNGWRAISLPVFRTYLPAGGAW